MIIRDFKVGDRRHYQVIGDDLTDVAQWLAATPARWTYTESNKSSRDISWDMGADWNETLRLAKEGWSKGAEMLSDRLSAHFPQRDNIDSWRYDVAGELPDIGRYLAGDPAHMRRHGHPKGHTPVISMLVNICCSGGISSRHFANYGAALCSVIDQLENSGRRVELNVSWISGFADGRASMGWTVKRAQDALDMAAVAFSLAHAAASRRIGFGMVERTTIKQSLSYGSVVKPTMDDWPDASEGMFLIQGPGHLNNTLSDAIAQVVKTVNECAGETLVSVEG